jgi:type 1 fimbriae regulatory protein FimB/type 1 fimbriae regulatory protein FimE
MTINRKVKEPIMGNVVAIVGTNRTSPNIENRKVREPGKNVPRKRSTPDRLKNSEYRSREYLTPSETEKLFTAARKLGRHGARDAALLMMAYRHGLRVSELVSLRWDQIDLKQGSIHVSRLKNGVSSVHPLRGPELRALRIVAKEYEGSPYVFCSERGGPMTPDGVRKIITRAGEEAGLGFPVHPHMLRHACGFKLANEGHDTRAIQQYLGHKNIQHTVRYTELSPNRFKDFWKD